MPYRVMIIVTVQCPDFRDPNPCRKKIILSQGFLDTRGLISECVRVRLLLNSHGFAFSKSAAHAIPPISSSPAFMRSGPKKKIDVEVTRRVNTASLSFGQSVCLTVFGRGER